MKSLGDSLCKVLLHLLDTDKEVNIKAVCQLLKVSRQMTTKILNVLTYFFLGLTFTNTKVVRENKHLTNSTSIILPQRKVTSLRLLTVLNIGRSRGV